MKKLAVAALLMVFFCRTVLAAPFSLKAKSSQDRMLAVFYLSRTRNPAYVESFCQLLMNDRSEKVREAAAEALGHYGNNTKALACLLSAFSTENEEDVRKAILLSLYSFYSGKSGRIFCKVLKGNYSSNLKVIAARGLAGYEGVCEKALRKLLDDGNDEEKRAALFALSFRKENSGDVFKFFDSGDVKLRRLAFSYYLSHVPSETVLEKIERRIANETDLVAKSTALEVVLTYDKNPDIDSFLSAVSDERVKRRLALRLPFVKNRKISAELLKPFLRDNDTVVLTSALTYVGNSGNRKYCSLIRDFLFSSDESVRSAAIWAEGRLSCREGVKYLLAIVSDLNNDDSLRLQAAKTLTMFDKSILRRNISLLEKAYAAEVLDDVKENIEQAILKAKN